MTVRPRLLRGSLLVAVVAVIAFAVVLATRDDDPPVGASDPITQDGTQDTGIARNRDVTGEPLPSAPVTDIDGNRTDTADLVGRPLVINIWFSTCAPCREELPAFAQVHGEVGDRVDFVGINQFPASDREEDFARDLGVTYPLFYDGDSRFISQLGVARYPVTLFVTPDGTIVRQNGEMDADELRAALADVFGSEVLG